MSAAIRQLSLSDCEHIGIKKKPIAAPTRTQALKSLVSTLGLGTVREGTPIMRGRSWADDSAISERYTGAGCDAHDMSDFGSQGLEDQGVETD